ncbi:MAG: Ig-like domain-containing protein [Syntrophales bacterium]|nr:Ig-like domain-containing protein [Syntrophales bacterium]
MRKVLVYFACFFILIIMGCGDTSGDPTARMETLTADSTDVTPGGSTVITVTVIKAGGTATTTTSAPRAWGENVTFKLLTANGAQLSVLTQKTDGDGKARTVYTAGNNYNEDVIQATLDNGMSASIVIKKTGNVSGASIKITTEPSPASVSAFGIISIVATVTDAARPISGETVEFKLVENNSGATLTILSSVTDAAGQAIATYRAGGNDPAQDVVQAKLLSNGAVSSVVIDVIAGAPGVSIDVEASPASVSAGQVSIVTATLTGDAKEGVTVTFTLPINSSGATLSAATATTDGSGKAVVTYQAGSQSPTLSVSDTVRAAVGSISSTAVITRTGSSTTTFSIIVSASPQTLASKTSSSVLTANVKNNLGTAVGGVTVTFTVTRGSLSASSVTTDGSGNAVTTFTGDNGATGSGIATASITVGGNTYTNAVVINIP